MTPFRVSPRRLQALLGPPQKSQRMNRPYDLIRLMWRWRHNSLNRRAKTNRRRSPPLWRRRSRTSQRRLRLPKPKPKPKPRPKRSRTRRLCQSPTRMNPPHRMNLKTKRPFHVEEPSNHRLGPTPLIRCLMPQMREPLTGWMSSSPRRSQTPIYRSMAVCQGALTPMYLSSMWWHRRKRASLVRIFWKRCWPAI